MKQVSGRWWRRADVNLGRRSRFPLREACVRNRPHIVRLLLELGADVNSTSLEGTTALHWVLPCR
jgi:ankyrin repeat protein